MMKLAEYRSKSKLSQTAIAKILYIPQRTYANYELEYCAAPLGILHRLCDLYNITMDELTGRTPPATQRPDDHRAPEIA